MYTGTQPVTQFLDPALELIIHEVCMTSRDMWTSVVTDPQNAQAEACKYWCQREPSILPSFARCGLECENRRCRGFQKSAVQASEMVTPFGLKALP